MEEDRASESADDWLRVVLDYEAVTIQMIRTLHFFG